MSDLGETGSQANRLALPVPLPPNPPSPYQGLGSGSGTWKPWTEGEDGGNWLAASPVSWLGCRAWDFGRQGGWRAGWGWRLFSGVHQRGSPGLTCGFQGRAEFPEGRVSKYPGHQPRDTKRMSKRNVKNLTLNISIKATKCYNGGYQNLRTPLYLFYVYYAHILKHF